MRGTGAAMKTVKIKVSYQESADPAEIKRSLHIPEL